MHYLKFQNNGIRIHLRKKISIFVFINAIYIDVIYMIDFDRLKCVDSGDPELKFLTDTTPNHNKMFYLKRMQKTQITKFARIGFLPFRLSRRHIQ